ncbi:MAG: hypothetical protein ABI851_07335 [Saprospiraceae bacterium]
MKETEQLIYTKGPSSLEYRLFGKLSLEPMDFVVLINRLSMFVVFFWFGFLKVMGLSPAESLIDHLYKVTISSYVSFNHFILFFGVFECMIGIMWLIPFLTIPTFTLFIIQMFTTFLPFYFLTDEVIPNGYSLTLTGQYIVKNIVLVSCAFTVFFNYKFKTKLGLT